MSQPSVAFLRPDQIAAFTPTSLTGAVRDGDRNFGFVLRRDASGARISVALTDGPASLVCLPDDAHPAVRTAVTEEYLALREANVPA